LQEKILQLERLLKPDEERWTLLGLVGNEPGLFSLLMNRETLSRATMQLFMSGAKNEAVTENAETVAIYRMNRKLRKRCIRIRPLPRHGYYLTKADKDRAHLYAQRGR
jgi:hypothetical protein